MTLLSRGSFALAEAAEEGAQAGAECEAEGGANCDPEPGVELTRAVQLDLGRVAELDEFNAVLILDAVFVALQLKQEAVFISSDCMTLILMH